MELTWWPVLIAGCVAAAICIAAALLTPTGVKRRRLRLLANVERLTELPEYRRAVRMRTVSAVVAIVLLAVAFGAAVVGAARPTGLPSAAQRSDDAQPEDIMLCIGAPGTDRAVGAALQYFADRMTTFGTERIGLTVPDRRVVPLTRDYQYAASRFRDYGTEQSVAVSYVDYAGGVEDVLAMCLTGFPSFEEVSAQRRSLIYVGPGSRRAAGETRPALFTADAVRDLAKTAGVQVNAIIGGSGNAVIEALARDTGGRSFTGDAPVDVRMSQIRAHPPPPTANQSQSAEVRFTETPDLPIVLALTALAGLVLWSAVRR